MRKQINLNIKALLTRSSFYVLPLVAFCVIPFALAERNATKPEAPTKFSQRTLTFAERVAYQRAIEEVYWRHRIWPKERRGPKPSLDAMMSQEQLEKKVADYLRNSQALKDYWQQPLTAEQLQAEMERMAQHTKQPEVLRELFEALGSDPFAIAECLARPTLTERLTSDLSAQSKARGFVSQRSKALRTIAAATMVGNVTYTFPKISQGDPPWTGDGSMTNTPDAREGHTAVWTGSEMIIWGGLGSTWYLNTGGRYNPATDSWTATSTTNAPDARDSHTAVWTGSEMIVWGGATCCPTFLNTGGRYNPGTDSWAATNTTNAPDARGDHTAVWTGSEMIIWGGLRIDYFNTGGRYNPATDSWTATSTTNAPDARVSHTAVWTGSEMIIWGGNLGGQTGGRYNPATDSWTATNTTNAPDARFWHTAVWTGSEMTVWGGRTLFANFNTGGRYNPGTDSWTATSTTNAPVGRSVHTAVWTGSQMIVWGGFDGVNYFNTGGKYNPSTNSWTATSNTNAPDGREAHTAVWTDSEMINWGGGMAPT
jgi:N-acetylneuraminic acid mutarotase